MTRRVRIGDAEFEVDFEISPDDPLPPGVEWMEDEGTWPSDTPQELIAYARELAISSDQVGHWVSFLAEHPQGRLAWAEIQRLWKPTRRRVPTTATATPQRRKLSPRPS